ncbi:MAG: hypothetical protein H0X24_19240 [Ktedonobacterales bacterium]|nr:hypothetical protein [Ktedonobacterales bacterium]
MGVRKEARLGGVITSMALLLVLCLGGCGVGSSGAPTTVQHPQETTTPAPTATTDPFAVPTPGVPCKGGEWGGVIKTVGKDVPLPPLTVRGTAQNLDPEASGWDGLYISLCTGGTADGITNFIDDHMTQLGWNYGPAVGGCTCSADNVWSRTNDPRLVQFERHAAEHDGQVRWGVICYRKGVFGC